MEIPQSRIDETIQNVGVHGSVIPKVHKNSPVHHIYLSLLYYNDFEIKEIEEK